MGIVFLLPCGSRDHLMIQSKIGHLHRSFQMSKSNRILVPTSDICDDSLLLLSSSLAISVPTTLQPFVPRKGCL